MPNMQDVTITLQALVAASLFFVWVVRYPNIVAEFKEFGLPDWLRDAVGVAKLTCALLLLIGIERRQFAITGGIALSLLMLAAFGTHIRMRNPVTKMLPSLALLTSSLAIVLIHYQLAAGKLTGSPTSTSRVQPCINASSVSAPH